MKIQTPKTRMNYLSAFMGFVALFLVTIPAAAKKGAVIFVKLEGVVRVQEVKSQEFLPAADIVVGKAISEGYSIETDDQAKAILLFSNGTLTTLDGKAKMTIGDFEQSSFQATDEAVEDLAAEPSTSKTKLQLDYGDMFFKVKTLAANSSFEIDSPVGSAGIRGTAGEMTVTPQPGGGSTGGVNMIEGSVDYTDPSGNTINVGAGQGVNVQTDANGNQVGQTQMTDLPQEEVDMIEGQSDEASESAADTTLDAVDSALDQVNPEVDPPNIPNPKEEVGEDSTQEVLRESATIINEIFQDATINGDPIPEDRLFDRDRLFTNEFTVKMIGTAAEYSGNADIGDAIMNSVTASTLNEENSFIGDLAYVLSGTNNLDILGSRNKAVGNLFNLNTDDFEAYLGKKVIIDTDRLSYYIYEGESHVTVTDTSAYKGYWRESDMSEYNHYEFVSFSTGEVIELEWDYEAESLVDIATGEEYSSEDTQLHAAMENKIVDLSERDTKIFAIASGVNMEIASDVTFSSRASTWDKEALAIGAANRLTIAEGKTIEYEGNYLGLGAKQTVELVEVTVKAQKGVGVGSLNDVKIENSVMEITSDSGGFGFFADNLLDIDGLTFAGGHIDYIYMEARTINLKDVHFPAGSSIDLYSELGPIDGKYPNFGSSVTGRVNFISDVSYGDIENVMHDRDTFDQFGKNVEILKY